MCTERDMLSKEEADKGIDREKMNNKKCQRPVQMESRITRDKPDQAKKKKRTAKKEIEEGGKLGENSLLFQRKSVR